MKILERVLIIAIFFFLVATLIVLYFIYTADPARQEVLEERTFEEDIEDMGITVENSRVEFLPSTDGTTRIVLTGNSDDFTLNTDLSGVRLEIEVEDRSRFFGFGLNRSSSLQVYMPENGLASLSANSDNGALQARDIQVYDLTFEAKNGRIELEAVESERIHVETANGRIEMTRIDADISVRASNGRIIFTDVSGELQARANNGRIDMAVDTLDFPVNLETNNGHIEIRTETEPANARIESRVDNGSIDIYGRDSEEVRFGNGDVLIELNSNNGRIVVE
ncbi:MAG TPA: DUF4097 family beta strand repeat-containing protein [Planococcus sp. (in: firmicutes)]|nr:DUF4097 family beta strand repeat-containing protein [Planococcus sp. (in: firmicutes)]